MPRILYMVLKHIFAPLSRNSRRAIVCTFVQPQNWGVSDIHQITPIKSKALPRGRILKWQDSEVAGFWSGRILKLAVFFTKI